MKLQDSAQQRPVQARRGSAVLNPPATAAVTAGETFRVADTDTQVLAPARPPRATSAAAPSATPVSSPAYIVESHAQLGPIAAHEAHVNGADVAASMTTPGVAVALTGRPSQRFHALMDQASSRGYRQSGYQLVDPAGDACLIKLTYEVPRYLGKGLAQQVPATVWNMVKSKVAKPDSPAAPGTAGEAEHQPAAPAFTSYKERPIKMDALMHQFMRDIQDSPYPPVLGEEHKWSPDAASYLHFGFARSLGRMARGKDPGSIPVPLMGRTKLFYMLVLGHTSQYAATGHEDELHDWMMKQKDYTIKPHDLLRESYRMNEGNLYKTFLTVESVLSKEWLNPQRGDQPEQKKLAYIRHDSDPRGDKFGAWYHLYGAALYSLMRPALVAKGVMETEALGSLFLEGTDRQEDHMNRQGAEFGSKVRKMVQDGSWQVKVPPGADTQYLVGRNWELEAAQQDAAK